MTDKFAPGIDKCCVDKQEQIAELRKWVADLQSRMYINCVYCGHRYGPKESTPVSMADVLKEHVERCPAHPMSKLRDRVNKLEVKNKLLLFELMPKEGEAAPDKPGHKYEVWLEAESPLLFECDLSTKELAQELFDQPPGGYVYNDDVVIPVRRVVAVRRLTNKEEAR